jgi:predicted secreted protein
VTTSSSIDLRVGDETDVRLPGLGAAGYRWEPQEPTEPDVVDVARATGPAAADAQSGDAPGSSRDESFVIRAIGPGQATVRLLQRRPWEGPENVLNEHVLHVRVTER